MRYCWFIISLAFLFLVSCKSGTKEQETGTSSKDPAAREMEELNRKIEENGSDPGLYNRRAQLFLLDKEFDKAYKDINLAISYNPKEPLYYITLSDIYLLQGQSRNCEESLNKALLLDPKNNEVVLKLAKLKLIVKEYPAAFQYVKKALELDPVNPRAYFIRAIALLEKGDTLHAVDDLKTAADQDQKFFDAYFELGELYSIKKDPLAVDYLRNALNIRPQSKEALYLLGMYYQENGQYEKALETYAILGRVDSTMRSVPYNTGYIYMIYMKDFPKAAHYFSLAIQKDPGYVEAYFNRGYAYELDGQIDKAYADYKMTLRLRTNYEKAIDGLNRLDEIRLKGKK
jgi:tetratricopeptide (TPR) repeat protein